ncbi:unnamed protein product, partial [Medioppia subpectinata]
MSESDDEWECCTMYAVLAPKVLRPNTDYHISVSLYDIPAPIEVNASVIGPAHSVSTGPVSFGTAESKVLTLAIGDWPKGRYKVRVEGKGANFTKYDETVAITTDRFLNELPLDFVTKCVSTDKATYKPGQKVQFRAVVVNPSLVPKDNIPIDIHIPTGKRVIECTKLYAKNGVICEELQLSAQPVLGHWTIGVTAFRHNTTKTFTVIADNTLPTTNVEIVLPTYVTVNQSQVVALVKAFDTNGKPVEGELTFYVRATVSYAPGNFETKAKINGSVTLTVNLIDNLKYNARHAFGSDFVCGFTARVIEAVTGKEDVRVEVVKPSETYKPRLKNTFVTRCWHYMLVIRTDTTTITVGQEVKFMVNATEPIVRLVCEVMGRGDIAWAKSFDIHTNITFGYEFSVATVNQMAPSTRVLCHYVRPDNRE